MNIQIKAMSQWPKHAEHVNDLVHCVRHKSEAEQVKAEQIRSGKTAGMKDTLSLIKQSLYIFPNLVSGNKR